MEKSKELLNKAGIIPILHLATKNEKGVPTTTGAHRVKMISEKLTKDTDQQTGKEIDVIWYLVEENGEKKRYRVPIKDKKGELHYLIQRLAEVKEGEEIVLEYKRKGMKGYIDVIRTQKVGEDIEEDVIDLDDHEDEQGVDGEVEEDKGKLRDIPF